MTKRPPRRARPQAPKRAPPPRPPQVLLAGFGPFPGVPRNPSGTLVRRIAARHRRALDGITLYATVLDTAWRRLDALRRLIEEVRPDLVVLVGVQRRARTLRIEQIAQTGFETRIPDVEGWRPGGTRAAVGLHGKGATAGHDGHSRSPGHVHTRVPVGPLVAELRKAAVPAKESLNAGLYLCNAAYRVALTTRVPTHPPRGAVLIHIPLPRLVRGSRDADLEDEVIAIVRRLTGMRPRRPSPNPAGLRPRRALRQDGS